jgi:putative membrane protein insertion efficiency factor
MELKKQKMGSSKIFDYGVRAILTRLVVWIIKLPILIYRLTFSSIVGHNCRYQPTCSAYSLEAIETHGPRAGALLSMKRLAGCHPWGKKSGFDPVPLHDHH